MKKNSFLAYLPFAVVLLMVSCGTKKKETSPLLLPVFGPRTINAEGDTVYHRIADFSFTDQDGETITQRNVDGKIFVSDFFFTTCDNICPAMSTQMIRVQEAYKNDPDFVILSHSVNPMHDTVEVLKMYAGKYGAIKNKWFFLTGDKKAINQLAEKSYFVTAQDDGTPEGFVHSEKFILADQKRRMRGVYDGTDSVQVDLLIRDIATLKKEAQMSAGKKQ